MTSNKYQAAWTVSSIPKEDGQPYYLMDLLTHSGIDFDHLDRPIRLAVNGVESGFQQIIRTDDSVEIRCI